MTAPADYTSAFYPNSQTGPASRRMLLGFDGWLTQQPADIQNDLTTHFRGFRDPAAVAAEKDRLAAIEFVHERTKAPRRQIADNWQTFRGGLAERLAEMPSGATNYEWEAVKDDDAGFVAMARKRAQFEQDRETMMDSVRSQAANAALSVDTGLADKRRLQVFSGFDGSEVPGYDPDDLPAIKAAYNETVQRVRINTQRERAVAREVADYLVAESGGEIAKIAADAADPSALGEAVQKILAIPKDRRPLAIEFVRQHLSAGGNEDVGLGMRGKKPKPVESTAGGGMRALGRGAADVWNKLKSASQRLSESTGLVDDASEFRDVQEQLRSLVNGTLDPLTPGGAIDTMVMGSAQSLPAMAMIAAGPVGRALSVTYYQQGSYEKFKADPALANVADSDISAMALISGTAQAALDSVQLGILTKMAGGSGLTKALQGIANPTAALGASGAYVAGQAGRFGAGLGLETGIEVLQNQYVDAAVQQVGAILGTGAPPDWAKVNAAAAAEFPELALTMIPLVAFGTTAGGIRDARSAAALARSPELLRAAGFGPSQALAISTAENPVGALRRLWNERNPMQGAPAGATPADVARQAWTDANEAAQSAVAAAQDARDTPGVAYVQRTDSGWQMVDTEGTNWQVAATESVPQLLVEAGKAATLKEGLAMQQIADAIAQREPRAKQQLTGERVTVTKTPGGVEVDSALKLIPFDAATLANFNAQLALLGGGNSAVVNGANWIAQDGTQMILANKSAEGVMTQAHEFVEARFRRFIDADIEFGNLAIRAAVIVAPLFDPAKTRTEERAFAERVQRVASGKTNETEARETMVELVVADVLGRRKDGSVMPTGSISAGITEAIAAATNPTERAALGKFRAFLRAVRSYLLGLFSTAAKLKKGRREGVIKEGDDFSVFAEKLLGLDVEREHVAAVTAAANAGATGSISVDTGGRMITPEQDAEYMAAVEAGDMEKAQAMVDAAAKAAGYNVGPVFQGVQGKMGNVYKLGKPNRAIKRLKDNRFGFFFSYDKNVAMDYTGRAAGKKGTLNRVFIGGNILDLTSESFDLKSLSQKLMAAGYEFPEADAEKYWRESNSAEPMATVAFDEKFGDDLKAWLVKNGYDGVFFTDAHAFSWRLSEGANIPNFTPVKTVVALDSSRIKLADAVTRDESGNVIPLPQRFNPARNEITFSLGSVATLEALAVQLENKIAAGGASVKLETYADTARTLEGMARAARSNESVERVMAIGEIERERIAMQRRMEAQAKEQIERDNSSLLEQPELADAFANEFFDYLFRRKEPGKPFRRSRILSKAAAIKQGIEIGNQYDGIDGLPKWLFSADGIVPDKITKELADTKQFGLPEVDATADADLWPRIRQILDSSEKYRKAIRKIEGEMIEAKARARTESRTWAAAQRAKLATSDARDEKRALITLDALLAKLPAEVRGRVGGFTRLADLTTNDARRKHLLSTLEKVDAEMERYLRREFVKEITATLQKGRAKKVAGQKDKGPLGVNAHTWLETAERYMVMGEADLEARELYIEAILGGAEMSDSVIQDLNRQWDLGTGEDAARLALEVEKGIAELFGGATHRDPVTREYSRGSGELEAAWKAAKERVEVGRMEWERELETRRQRREGRRAGLAIDSGNAGRPADVQARREAMQGMGGVVTRYFRKGFSFSEFIGDGFGRESDTHRFAEDTAMEATLTTSALWQASQNGLRDFLKALWPRSGTAARLRNLEALSTPKEIEGAPDSIPKLSELQAVHLTMLWQDEQSRPWLRKWGYGDGVPEDPQDPVGPNIQAALEAHLSPHAKLIREWLGSRYDEQYDALNDVFRRLHGVNMPRVKNYTPRMVEHGKDAAVSDPLGGGALSARGVFAGFTKRRRINIGAAPVLEDALRAYTQNQRVVTHFIGWAEASNELRAVFSTSASAPFVKGAMGEQGAADLNQWLSDLEAGGVREVEGSAIWQRWLKANTASALFGKLGVLAKQIPAAYGAAVEIGWGDYIRSARRVLSGTAARPLAGSRIMDIRRFQRPAEIGQAASGTGVSPWDSRLRRIGIPTEKIDLAMDWIGGRIGEVDAFFTSRGAAIAYDAHFQDGKAQRMDDVAAHAYAERETERTISRTAQPDQIMNKSKSENYAGTWGRLLHQFQSANRQALFMTVAAFRDGGVKSGDAWRKALTHWVLTGIVTQTVGTLVRDAMSDDNDDELWKLSDYVRAILLGPLTGAVHFGPLIDAMASLFGGFERRQAPSPIAALADVGKEVVELSKDDEDFDWKDQEKIVRSLGLLLGGRWGALGVAENIGKQAVGTVDNLSTTEAEALERDAKRQRAAEKDAREARESALTPEQREALRDARKANREKRMELDAAKWRALNPP